METAEKRASGGRREVAEQGGTGMSRLEALLSEGFVTHLLEITMNLCFKYFLCSSKLTVGTESRWGDQH